MSDHDPGRYDAVQRLRRKWEQAKAEDGESNVVRLPKRPRRGGDDIGDARQRPWGAGAVDDPAPTRPVTRAELERESGAWLAAAVPPPAPDGEHENTVIDFEASRRKRADSATGSVRPRVRPRRIDTGEKRRGGDPDPTPGGPGR
ncbi:hypothetical protein [Nocardia sp. AG03]|uniref:hypothetical protein n=1 Tax=Nocardia sp. AG03 TaxID=3025312 RepID=UPI0024181984|nr:hypothetical protein [Nocardia sp. AG03]